MSQVLEMPLFLFSSLEPLLVRKLKVLTLKSIAWNSSTAEALSHSLQSQHCSLLALTLDNCRFRSNAATQLTIGIVKNTSLHRVALCDCQLDSADFKVLADALRGSKTLKEVEIEQPGTAVKIDKAAIQALKKCNQNITFQVRV